MRLILIGAPGVGKGTQAIKLCERLGLPHLSTGDIFRSHMRYESDLGRKVKSFISKGRLVPDEIIFEIVLHRIELDDCKEGFVWDGFPRTLKQAMYFDELLNVKKSKIDKAINLVVSEEIIVTRMTGRRICESCGASYHIVYIPPKQLGSCDLCQGSLVHREDDTDETVKQRIEIYHAQTEPILQYYREKGILLDVFGKDDVTETAHEIYRMLGV